MWALLLSKISKSRTWLVAHGFLVLEQLVVCVVTRPPFSWDYGVWLVRLVWNRSLARTVSITILNKTSPRGHVSAPSQANPEINPSIYLLQRGLASRVDLNKQVCHYHHWNVALARFMCANWPPLQVKNHSLHDHWWDSCLHYQRRLEGKHHVWVLIAKVCWVSEIWDTGNSACKDLSNFKC